MGKIRSNPHVVIEWHRRASIFDDNPKKQILSYFEAINVIDRKKAIGQPHTLWCALARLYEQNQDLDKARSVFSMAENSNSLNHKDMIEIYSEWVNLEINHNFLDKALNILQRVIYPEGINNYASLHTSKK